MCYQTVRYCKGCGHKRKTALIPCDGYWDDYTNNAREDLLNFSKPLYCEHSENEYLPLHPKACPNADHGCPAKACWEAEQAAISVLKREAQERADRAKEAQFDHWKGIFQKRPVVTREVPERSFPEVIVLDALVKRWAERERLAQGGKTEWDTESTDSSVYSSDGKSTEEGVAESWDTGSSFSSSSSSPSVSTGCSTGCSLCHKAPKKVSSRSKESGAQSWPSSDWTSGSYSYSQVSSFTGSDPVSFTESLVGSASSYDEYQQGPYYEENAKILTSIAARRNRPQSPILHSCAMSIPGSKRIQWEMFTERGDGERLYPTWLPLAAERRDTLPLNVEKYLDEAEKAMGLDPPQLAEGSQDLGEMDDDECF